VKPWVIKRETGLRSPISGVGDCLSIFHFTPKIDKVLCILYSVSGQSNETAK